MSEVVSTPEQANFGPLLRRIRMVAGLTQEALAERAGVGTRSIQGFERGERRPHRETVKRLIDALDASGPDRQRLVDASEPAPRRTGSNTAFHGSPPLSIERRHDGEALPRLSVSLTSFIGREHELSEIGRRLLASRLVTLTGPPGVGKTRLGMESANQLAGAFDEVFFVPLAAIRDPNLLLTSIASTLGVTAVGRESLIPRFAARLKSRRSLLFLDNFEQVADAAPLVAQLLEACPRLTLLVTSRSRLRVRGEREIVVPPLTLPRPDDLTVSFEDSLATVNRSEATRLFLERTHEAGSKLVATRESLMVVVEICRQLEGLPLSIELAAAWCKVLTPAALLARLKSRLAFLTAGAVDLPARQRTLRDAISWSYDLLTSDEQTLFRQLAVFVGGFTLDAAEAICDASVETMTALVDKSLVRLDRSAATEADTDPRFTMFETIRDFAAEHLSASGDTNSQRKRHADYFLAIAVAAQAEFHGPRQTEWVNRLERNDDNLRAALRFFLDTRDVEHALTLGQAMQDYWMLRCQYSGIEGWIGELASLTRSSGREADQAQVLRSAGRSAMARYDHAQARNCLEESLILARHVGDRRGVAEALGQLGLVVRSLGDYALSYTLTQESLDIYRGLSDDWAVGCQLDRVGMMAFYLGDDSAAHSFLEESLQVRQVAGDPDFLAWSLLLIGQVAHHEGDYLTARHRYAESLTLWRERNYVGYVATALASLGDLTIDEGDFPSARLKLVESLQRSSTIGDMEIVEYGLECLAGLAAVQDEPERAYHLAGAAAALRATTGPVCPPDLSARLDRRMVRAREQLGDKKADRAFADGQSMTLAEAVDYALTQADSETRTRPSPSTNRSHPVVTTSSPENRALPD